MLFEISIPASIDVRGLLGPSERLIVFDTSSLGIVHPKIAEEVLAQVLTRLSAPARDTWKLFLADFCVSFVRALSRNREAHGENVKDILIQLFVEQSRADDTHQPRLFSTFLTSF